VAAVGELETEYGDRVRFVIVEPEETAQRAAEIQEFGFASCATVWWLSRRAVSRW
jgi:hypothetical protein